MKIVLLLDCELFNYMSNIILVFEKSLRLFTVHGWQSAEMEIDIYVLAFSCIGL